LLQTRAASVLRDVARILRWGDIGTRDAAENYTKGGLMLFEAQREIRSAVAEIADRRRARTEQAEVGMREIEMEVGRCKTLDKAFFGERGTEAKLREEITAERDRLQKEADACQASFYARIWRGNFKMSLYISDRKLELRLENLSWTFKAMAEIRQANDRLGGCMP
jgi:hypothetical protein